MVKKLNYLWDNIMHMYIKIGKDYHFNFYVSNYCTLSVDSNDNYFQCTIHDLKNNRITNRKFKISIEYSFLSDPKIYLEDYTELGGIDGIIEYLKPVFREFKLDSLNGI
jgi:hypothetical protein